MRNKSTMVIDLRPGESLDMSGVVQVEFVHKSGNLARLRVIAPREVKIKKKSAEPGDKSDASMAD